MDAQYTVDDQVFIYLNIQYKECAVDPNVAHHSETCPIMNTGKVRSIFLTKLGNKVKRNSSSTVSAPAL